MPDRLLEPREPALHVAARRDAALHSLERVDVLLVDPAQRLALARQPLLVVGRAQRVGMDEHVRRQIAAIGPDLTQTPQVDYLTGWEDADDLWESWAPVGRLGWPEDQARVALFLASDMSAFVTGVNIPVDGGSRAGGGWFWSPTEHRFVNRPKTL